MYGSLAVYNGGFDPANPTAGFESWNGEEFGHDDYCYGWKLPGSYFAATSSALSADACGYSNFNHVSMTLNPGQSKFVVATSYLVSIYINPLSTPSRLPSMPVNTFKMTYDLSVNSYTPMDKDQALAFTKTDTIAQGNIHWYKVTGLQPLTPYSAVVMTADYAKGDDVWFYQSASGDKGWSRDSWDYDDAGPNPGVQTNFDSLRSDSDGSMWIGAYGNTVLESGKYTIGLVPGGDQDDNLGGYQSTVYLGFPYGGGIDSTVTSTEYSIYDWDGPGIVPGVKYKVVVSNITDPALIVWLGDGVNFPNGETTNCGAIFGDTITCSITSASESYLVLAVDGSSTKTSAALTNGGTPTVTGATYLVTATIDTGAPNTGVTNQAIGTTTDWGFVSKTATWSDSWATTAGYSYDVWFNAVDSATTFSIAGATSTCKRAPIPNWNSWSNPGGWYCLVKATGDTMTVTANASQTAAGSDIEVRTDDTGSTVKYCALGDVTACYDVSSQAGNDPSTYSAGVSSGIIYTLVLSNVTDPNITVTWKDNGEVASSGTCGAVSSGTLTCTTLATASYADTLTFTVMSPGSDTSNGSFYDVLIR
jgi:hypothetical protein